MSKVAMTVRQIMDLGLWDKVCEFKGWSEWIYNEGRIEEDELVEFDSEFRKVPSLSLEAYNLHTAWGEQLSVTHDDEFVYIYTYSDGNGSSVRLRDEEIDGLIDYLQKAKAVIN